MAKINRNWLFFPLIAIGVLILYYAINSRPEIPIKPALGKAKAVNVMLLEQQSFAPVITGFGRVEPKRRWQGIAEVSGKVVYRNPQLERGQIVAKDTLLLRIDPTDYQIAVAKAQADINTIEAKLAKLTLDKTSLATSLNLEQRSLRLIEKELVRQSNLKAKGLLSQSALDNEQQAVYAQKNQVNDLQSKLKLLPLELAMATAELEAAKLVLTQAQRDLARTELRLPFTSRIADINIEKEQFVTNNLMMVESHGLDNVEVEAQFSIHDVQLIFASLATDFNDDFTEKLQQLTAEVTLSSGNFSHSWQAKVARLSDTVDLDQATVGVILEVPVATERYSLSKPSLVNGMFVKAEITGKAQPQFVVPERALHGETLYVAVSNKLAIVPVEVLFRYQDRVAIKPLNTELHEGSLVVINDLIPALTGMALQVIEPPTLVSEVTP